MKHILRIIAGLTILIGSVFVEKRKELKSNRHRHFFVHCSGSCYVLFFAVKVINDILKVQIV